MSPMTQTRPKTESGIERLSQRLKTNALISALMSPMTQTRPKNRIRNRALIAALKNKRSDQRCDERNTSKAQSRNPRLLADASHHHIKCSRIFCSITSLLAFEDLSRSHHAATAFVISAFTIYYSAIALQQHQINNDYRHTQKQSSSTTTVGYGSYHTHLYNYVVTTFRQNCNSICSIKQQ